MSTAPLDRAGPWTLDDLADVDDEVHRYEVVDGSLLVSPPPTRRHQLVGRRLHRQLLAQEGEEWEAVREEYLRLGTDGRQPDVALLRRDAPEPPEPYGWLPASFGLVVEVVSPTSRRRDRVHKLAEYADAGIPYYWLVETEPEVEVIAFELVAGAYRERARLTAGVGPLPGPVPLQVDVEALRA